MSKVNKTFGNIQDERIKGLIDNAEIHKETHHISFKVPTELTEKKELKFGSEVEVVEHAVGVINGYGLAVERAVTEIGHQQFADTKHETWDGRLALFEGLTMNADVRLREVIGEDTIYGGSQLFIDHPHTQEMVDWYSNYQESNAERAKKLFD